MTRDIDNEAAKSFGVRVARVNGRCCVNRGCDVFNDRGRMDCVSNFLDDSVETVVGVGGIIDHADRTVRLVQTVGTLNDVTVTDLVLTLDVTRMRVIYAVVVRVLWIGL